jgi:thioredoxin-like negative regulator of GroEL
MRVGMIFLHLCLQVSGTVPPFEPAVIAARESFEKNDYQQSLTLWQEISSKHPDDFSVALKLVDLRFLVDGRDAARKQFLEFGKSHMLTPNQKNLFRQRLQNLNEFFITNEAQSLFLQAKMALQNNDRDKERDLLQKCENLEQRNSLVLTRLAQNYHHAAAYEQYAETLSSLHQINPFDESVLTSLVESLLFLGKPAAVVSALKPNRHGGMLTEQRLAYAAALFETGEREQARMILHALARSAPRDKIHPAVWYYLSLSENWKGPVKNWRVLRAYKDAMEKSAKEWNPYRLPTYDQLLAKNLDTAAVKQVVE